MTSLLTEIVSETGAHPELQALASDCRAVAQWMRETASLDDRLAGSVAFCTMCAVAVAGWQLIGQADALGAEDSAFARLKRSSLWYLVEVIVPETAGLRKSAMFGSTDLYALEATDLVSAT